MKRVEITCDDCYFRKLDICALQLERPCPTFRQYHRGALLPPPQPPLIARAGYELATAGRAA